MGTVLLNGQFVAASGAAVSVFDGGFLHGAGLFETMRAENGRIFRLDSHLTRLCNSAGKLLQPLERPDLPAQDQFRELLDRNELREARVRLTVTAGPMREGIDSGDQGRTICVTASPLVAYPAAMYQRGVSVVICQCRQSAADPTAGHKTTAYLPRLLGLRHAHAAGCQEALWFTYQNQLAEGCISNVFVVREGRLRTPPLDTPVLPGIARGVVLQLAAQEGIPFDETPLHIHDLLDADEVFLTNTIMQVIPVVRVEKHDIGGRRVGPLVPRLLAVFRRLVGEECGIR